jgi:hypothetical protein
VKDKDYILLAIDISVGDYNTAFSKEGLILIMGILSMLISIGMVIVCSMKGKDRN